MTIILLSVYLFLLMEQRTRPNANSYTVHEPISIDGNADSKWKEFPGNGTIDNPKIIERLRIRSAQAAGSGDSCIELRNCQYIIIRNCFFESDNLNWGIHLENVSFCIIENNLFLNAGLYILFSNNITVQFNTFNSSAGYSSIACSKDIFIKRNTFYNFLIQYAYLKNAYIFENNFYSSGIQAPPEGTNGIYFNNSSIGNYWSHWTAPDTNNDGIVDTPMEIWYQGALVACDYYPSVRPFSQHCSSSSFAASKFYPPVTQMLESFPKDRGVKNI